MKAMLANLAPELMLTGIACILFLLGYSNKRSSRQMAPFLALIALVFILIPVFARRNVARIESLDSPVIVDGLAHFIRALTPLVAILLLLLAWPTNREQTDETGINLRRSEPVKMTVIPVQPLRHVPGYVVGVSVRHARRNVQHDVVGVPLRERFSG